MSGLIDTNTGLRFGTGLIWLTGGLGGDGLDVITSHNIIFSGAGSLSAVAGMIQVVSVRFAGSSTLMEIPTVQEISAIFGGSGILFEFQPGSGPSLDFSDPNNSQYIGMFP